MDGYESEFNVDIAKYLSKYLMYISFPREGANTQGDEVYQKQKSEHLLRKYFYGGLSLDEKKELVSLFKMGEKETNKNLHVYPIYSKHLNELYDLQGVEQYESSFINFMM